MNKINNIKFIGWPFKTEIIAISNKLYDIDNIEHHQILLNEINNGMYKD